MHLCMECTQMKKLNNLWTCIFLVMYQLPNPLWNAQQHQHTCTSKNNNNVVYKFHYSLLPMHETKKFKPFQINGIYPFSQQYFHTQTNKIFQSLKDFFFFDDISFYGCLNSLNLDESTYILNLRSKLTHLKKMNS
jgi:hypothetical protein